MKIKVEDLRPNPFRNLPEYSIGVFTVSMVTQALGILHALEDKESHVDERAVKSSGKILERTSRAHTEKYNIIFRQSECRKNRGIPWHQGTQ